MTQAARALEYVQLAVFVLVAVIAAARWIARRGATRAWLAATFGLLGMVLIAGEVMPDEPEGIAGDIAVKALVALLVLFPYFLYRFMASFERPPAWLERTATAATVGMLVFTAFLPHLPGPDEPQPAVLSVYIFALLAQWTVLVGAVSVRLWRAGHGQPTVARRRMRLLGAGAAALAFVLIVALVAPDGDEVTATTIVTECIAIVSALLFVCGFAPPRSLLRSWRARDLEAVQGALVELAQATSPQEVVEELLPRVVRLVGAQGAAIYRTDGALLGRVGETREDPAGEGVAVIPGVTQHAPDQLSLEVPGGRLELTTNAYTPYFGREELDLLRTIGALVHVTLERTHAHVREVAAREALDEAQRIAHLGSWRVDLATGHVDASDEMYRLYGLEPQSMPLTREVMRGMVHPDDVAANLVPPHVIAEGGDFAMEYRVPQPDGSVRWIAARGSAIQDDSGAVVALLGTCQDVTEARRLEQMRQEFVANAAHELRTPLTTVSAMASLLATQRDRLSDTELQRAFDALGRQGQRARTLVSSLLDLSRLEAGRVPVQLAPTEVAQVVARALETAPPPVSANVAVDVAPGVLAVADPDRLEEILVNLLSNAYRYGGPSVRVSASNGDGSVRVAVTDDGNGVPGDFVRELFEPFSRAGAVTGTPGSGLGLAISHRLARALGGELTYDHDEAGGARFTVTLRAAR
ncbi:MAG TPA: PAS domain-containing sensor histidine kinase [Frankiaceae bacterium]|nr:PAS domain-containing sensor histidine kinase [Frankiaceae bacterium]